MIRIFQKLPVSHVCLLALAATITLTGTTPSLADVPQIVALCRQYLAAEGDARSGLEARIREYDGPVEPVLEMLAAQEATDWQKTTGVLTSQHFKSPKLKAAFPDDLLHFYIPGKYTPTQPMGLLIFMHGGGRQTPRDDPPRTQQVTNHSRATRLRKSRLDNALRKFESSMVPQNVDNRFRTLNPRVYRERESNSRFGDWLTASAIRDLREASIAGLQACGSCHPDRSH